MRIQVTYAELRRAHLLLCLFAHAYVWGGPEPLDHIPEVTTEYSDLDIQNTLIVDVS